MRKSCYQIPQCRCATSTFVLYAATLFIACSAVSANSTFSYELPSVPKSAPSIANKDYRLHDVKTLDGIPVFVVDIFSGTLEWDTVNLNKLPSLTVKIPDNLYHHIDLYYSNSTGWIMVPHGWQIHDAAEGADGNMFFTFVAPQGGQQGWMRLVNIPACVGCMYEEADGLIPGVHRLYENLLMETIPSPRLVPRPESISNPNACMAILRYKTPSSPPVKGIVFLGDGLSSLYMALPDKEKPLEDFLFQNFLQTLPACQSGN